MDAYSGKPEPGRCPGDLVWLKLKVFLSRRTGRAIGCVATPRYWPYIALCGWRLPTQLGTYVDAKDAKNGFYAKTSHLGNADSKIFESNWLSLRGTAAVVARSWALSPPSAHRKRAGGEEAARSGEDEREGVGCEDTKDGVNGDVLRGARSGRGCHLTSIARRGLAPRVENVADGRGEEAQEGAEDVYGLGGEVVLSLVNRLEDLEDVCKGGAAAMEVGRKRRNAT
ncbi:hypothetical protein B0H17DRAFT_1126958 [Mycena rosella]|uniref:Uncharacterized protein n=1 Tax=Mycena rosella TaxID=1033263 RepID=A0AAD7GRU9_MYCRO|nr:hypothetical protein B0H17DRAFT_1126958 [Mycena rosella]